MEQKENNVNPVIWITRDVEEYDVPDIEYLIYKGKKEKCYERDVDVFAKNVESFQVGDYILFESDIIPIDRANIWKITYIFEPDKHHPDPKKCRRMLISECWKTLKLESRSLFGLKNNLGDFKYMC